MERRPPVHARGKLWTPAFAGASALREDALFAWWKSVSEPVASSVIEGNCVAVRRGGEQPEMNRQSVEPAPAQAGDDEPDSACSGGEPARSWRSPEAAGGAEATDKATAGPPAWLRSECREGRAE